MDGCVDAECGIVKTGAGVCDLTYTASDLGFLFLFVLLESKQLAQKLRLQLVGALDTPSEWGEIPSGVCRGLKVLSFEDHFTRSTVGIG